jgi:hypothetical protein
VLNGYLYAQQAAGVTAEVEMKIYDDALHSTLIATKQRTLSGATGGGPYAAPLQRARVSVPWGSMAELHVTPDPRTGTWQVRDARDSEPRSEHPTVTEAEVAAQANADARDVERIVIHDRYARTRELIRRGRAWFRRH